MPGDTCYGLSGGDLPLAVPLCSLHHASSQESEAAPWVGTLLLHSPTALYEAQAG